MAAPYTRPGEGFRYAFGGIKTNSPPDAVGPTKYPLAINVRGTQDNTIITRPGQTQQFLAGAAPIVNLRAYARVNSGDAPRVLAYDATGLVWLDTGVNVGGAFQALSNKGASMLPFRPAQSPNPYMYVADGLAYQKFSAPDALGAVTVSAVGIAEPQAPPDTGPGILASTGFSTPSTNGGTAGGPAPGTRTTGTLSAVFAWPSPAVRTFSVVGPSGSGAGLGRWQGITINGTNPAIITDVFANSPGGSFVTVQSIFYYAGNTGRCVIVPANLGAGPGNSGESEYTQALLANLRRGSIIDLSFGGGGSELVMVLSVTEGPDGTVSFETSTPGTHHAGDTFVFVASFVLTMLSPAVPVVGQTAVTADQTFAVTAGIGTMSGVTPSPFLPGSAFQDADLIHFSVRFDLLANLTELKFLIDVGDGTFTQNFYYMSLRPSDLLQGTTNALTQLAVAQIYTQRSIIDEEASIAAKNQGRTYSSYQSSAGDAQWLDVTFPVSALTRVGSDLTLSLTTANAIQFLINASGTLNVALGDDIYVGGGSQPDVGDVGEPYLYRIRPRSSVTGAVGNPSPATRYGLSLRRQAGLVALPTVAYDPQFDTWDVYRFGGSVTSWRFIGSQTVGTTPFIDNFADAAALAGDALDFDNFEPWPTIDFPLNARTISVTGTTALVQFFGAVPPVAGYLPGNLVRLGGQNVYTLWTRPVLFAVPNIYLFQFAENAGAAGAVAMQIYEPELAAARLPYMWGPDVNGTVFAVGDKLRPGTLYFSKPYAPDSAPDNYNLEIVQPSEPLLGGEIVDGLSFVASSERWWALYFTPDNPQQRYNFVQTNDPRGLAAPFGHCNDGISRFWWAKDGIYSSTAGNLTDADLHNLFPYEGVPGSDYVYNGVTIHAPDYEFAGSFRLAFGNGFLYATYLDSTQAYRTLVYDIRRSAWVVDDYGPAASAFYHVEQEAALAPGAAPAYPSLLMASVASAGTSNLASVSTQTPNADDVNGLIPCTLATWEFDGGDIRAGKQWGDLYLDIIAAAAGIPVRVQPTSFGADLGLPTLLAASPNRTQQPISLAGGVLADFLGLMLTWTDSFGVQGPNPTQLFAWQPSFIPKPETIADRDSDWDDAGVDAAKWWQGFILHADTFNAVKGFAVVDSDTGTVHPFTPAVQLNGEGELAFSFVQPFIAHMVRIVPTDQVPWRFFGVRWVTEPTPEAAETWATQPSIHGLKGYMHLRQIGLTYASGDPVTFIATSYDGMSPIVLNFPATAGAVVKTYLPFSANKGLTWRFSANSPSPFQIYLPQSEVLVGQWGRGGEYANVPLVGGNEGDMAKI